MVTDSTPPLLEVCCASTAFAVEAVAAGADRVELCADLTEGGTTPSIGEIVTAVELLDRPAMVMIRPRGGDFLYSDVEYRIMERDVDAAREAGAHGVVFGILDADGCVDIARTRALVDRARPAAVTFHRAFDVSSDLLASVDALIEAGVDRVLTSAGRSRVVDALDTLAAVARAGSDRLTVVACGGLRAAHVPEVLAVPGVREIHVGASRFEDGPMRHRVTDLPMGRSYTPDEYVREVVDSEQVRNVSIRIREMSGA